MSSHNIHCVVLIAMAWFWVPSAHFSWHFFLLVVFVLFSRIQYHSISCALMVSFEYFPLCVNEYTEEILTHAQYSHYTIYPSVHFAHVTIYMHSIFSLAVVQIFATRHYNDRQMLRIHSQSHTYFTYLTN